MAQAENQAEAVQVELDLDGVEPQDVTVDAGHEAESVDGIEAGADKPDELADLRKQLEDSNRRATEAESRANSLHAERSASENRLATEVNGRFAAQEQAIDTRAASAKQMLTTVKAEMVRAQAEQRYEDFANLQEQMAEAKLEERAAAYEKSQITHLKERAAADIEANNNRSRDPSESFLATIPGDRSRQWLRNHPDILKRAATSSADAKRLFGYAQVAEADGHAPDSPEYFDAIEKQFGLKEQEPVVTQQPARETRPAPKAPGQTANAAPSNRSASPAQASRTVTLDDVVRKLTPNDRANAKISFPDKPADEAAKLYAQGIVISKQREPGFRPDIRL